MKSKMFLGISCVAVAIAGVMYVSKSNSVKLLENDLLMENVEALASGEGFNGTFNGTNWDTDNHFYNMFGTEWCPVLIACNVTSGSFNANVSVSVPIPGTPVTAGGSIGYNGPTSTYPGHYISCHSGSGNCYNGTDCIRD